MKPRIVIDPSKCRPHKNPDPLTQRSFPIIPDVMETDWICDTCGKIYIALTLNGKLWTTGNCIPCSDKIIELEKDHEMKGNLEKRKQNFSKLCPESYKSFKKELLPKPSCYEKVLEWDYSTKKGLIMIGDSGLGKTRCAWQLMKRLYVLEWIEFKAITELQFSHEVANFGKSDNLAAWMNKLCTCKVLFIDDLGKSVMTERVTSELFYVLEERTKHKRPTIITMQIEASNLYQKFSSRSGKEIAEAILNRLKAHCEIINF